MAGRETSRTHPTGKERELVRAFVAIGGLVVLALLGVLIAPFFIDWTVYRTDFEREASRILGHAVVVRGEASARLLPFPSVTFTDVIVAGETPADKPLMTIAGFRMDAELAPYLSGEIRIFSMTLDTPRLRVPLTRDGSLAFVGASARLPTKATIVLEDVEIAHGAMTIENGLTGRVHEISDIEARFSARALTGPFSGIGMLTAGGRRLGVTLSSGPVQPETGLPLKLTVDSPSLDASLVLDGIASVKAGAPGFDGTLKLTSPLPKAAAATPAGPLTAPGGAKAADGKSSLLPPLDLSGKLTATSKSIAVSDMRVAAGGGETPYILTGSGGVELSRLPHFMLSLEGEQVDVDSIAAKAPAKENAPRPPVTFDQRLDAARAVFQAVPRPAIPGTIKVALPVVVAGDTTIRDVAFTVSPTDTGWSVERFAAELPGRTKMEATGVVGLDDPLSFRGDLLVASRQPSGFSDWLTGAVDPAIRTLPQAGFSAKVDLTRAAQRFEDLEIDIGGDTLRGRLERSGPHTARQMTAALDAGKVDLDALLALSRLFTGEDDSIADAERLSLKIAAGPVTYAGADARRIDADLSYDGEKLQIARLDLGDLAGANVKMSGELGGLSGDLSGRLAVAVDAAQPERAIGFLKGRLPPSPALEALLARGPLLGPLSLAGEVRTVAEAPGEKPTLSAKLTGTAAKTALDLSLALGNGIYASGTSGRFGLDLALSSATPTVLLGQLGLDAVPVEPPGPLSVQLSLSAGTTGPVVAHAAMRAPGTELTAEGHFDVATTGVTAAEIGLAAKSEDLSPWLLATGAALGQSPLERLPVEASGALGWGEGDLTLRNIAATVAGVEVTGELERHGGGPVTGGVFVSDLSLPWLATLVYGREPGERAGTSSWPIEEFATPLLPPVEMVLDLTADRLRLTGGTAVSDFAAIVRASDGQLGFSDIKGAVAGGYVAGSAALRNANGIGGVSLKAEVSGLDLGALALGADDGTEQAGTESGGPEAAVAGTLDATLSLDGTGQSYSALVSSLTGAGTVHLDDASFVGIRPGMFAPILAAADAEGFVPGNETAAGILATLAEGARYPVPSLDDAFAMAAGVARFSPATLAGTGETLSGDGAIDLRDMTASAMLRLDLDPGDDSVEGAAPSIVYALSGPLAAPRLTADPQPLASYLSVRAFEREQARVEAMQEQLQERLRLRREARYTRWREAARIADEAARAVADEAERLRLERQRETEAAQARDRAAMDAAATAAREAEAQKVREAEAAKAAEAAEAERERQAEEARREEAARQAQLARQAEETRKAEEARQAKEAERIEAIKRRTRAPRAFAVPDPSPPAPAPATPATPPALDLENPVPPPDFQSLPGVNNPLKF